MMRILIVMSGGFDKPGPSWHLYKALLEDMVAAGHSVHLIESHSAGLMPDCPDSLKDNPLFSYEAIQGVRIEKRRFVYRYIRGVKYCFDAIPRLKKQKGFDVVMVQSCPWAPFIVSFAKKYVKAPTVWNIQDMFPGASIANGVMDKKWMQSFFYRLHNLAYRKADHMSVISEDMKQKVIEQGVSPERITVIPDWYDDKSVKEIPWDENLFVKKYDMRRDVFYVQYAGTMGFNFDYRMVIKVAELLKDQKDIVFQMIGLGSQKDAFVNAAQEAGLDNIVFLPLEPQEMVPHVYSACSVCLIPLPRGVIGNSVPSKAGLLMACRRVIVNSVDEDSDYYQMFEREQIGISAPNTEAQAVAAAILKLRDDPELRERYAENAKKFSRSFYSRTVNTQKHIDLLAKLAGEQAE